MAGMLMSINLEQENMIAESRKIVGKESKGTVTFDDLMYSILLLIYRPKPMCINEEKF